MRTSTLKPDRASVQAKVFIESAGIKHPTYTTHHLNGFKLEPDPAVGWLRPQWAVQYKCSASGALRKYGVIDATDISDVERSNEEPMR